MFKSRWAHLHKRHAPLVLAIVLLAALVPVGGAVAAPPQNACDKRTNNTYGKVLECVRVAEVR